MLTLNQILMSTQAGLSSMLAVHYPKAVVCQGQYILVPGDLPILLVAHLDTVHKTPVKHICQSEDGLILMSPEGIGGDDRCGVYALVTLYDSAPKEGKPWLLFTCDEETGAHGAYQFLEDFFDGLLPPDIARLKLLIELDRKGERDAVYYECENPDLENYITSKGFETAWGSFSDISVLAPDLGIAAVNLSVGYYNAHTQHEYINLKHLEATIARVKGILHDVADSSFSRYAYMTDTASQWIWGEPLTTPKEQRTALLEIYPPEELDAIQSEMGDTGIRMLYEDALADGIFWY